MPKKTKKRGKTISKPKVANDAPVTDASAAISNDDNQYIDPPIKSDVDDNNYRIIKLANGLTTLLVSSSGIDSSEDDQSSTTNKDRENGGSQSDEVHSSICDMENPGWFQRIMRQKRLITKEAYFELCVNVGSYNDPRQVPGASRLLSKIILRRSMKSFEEDDDFRSFLWQLDGYVSVDDDGEKTVYLFDVQLKYLTKALERFSESLISPRLLLGDIISLRNELLHEGKKNLLDTKKMIIAEKQHLFKNLASSKHSARAYGKDYLKGLSLPNDDKVYKEVIKFRERHYSAHRMTVVLKADLSLETLEEYVKMFFSKVPNNGLPVWEFTQYNFMNTFDEPKYQRIYKLNSYAPSDLNYQMLSANQVPQRMELTWSMPPSRWLYRTKPGRYWAWLIVHEGEGSLIRYLRKNKLCVGITSGIGDKEFEDNSIYALFTLSVTLTDAGHKNYRKVLDAIFSYLNFLRREGLQSRIYDEIRQIEGSRFRYQHHFDEDDNVKRLSEHMHLYPPADYLTGKHLYFDYDPVAMRTYVNLMSPERANIILYEKSSEPLLLSNFPSDEIPEKWLQHWKHAGPLVDFKLPEPNAFQALDFSLIPVTEGAAEVPVKIHSDSLVEIWHSIGSLFRSPTCSVNIFYISPLPLMSPINAAMTDMVSKVLESLTSEELYPAKAVGMTFAFERWRDEGIVMRIEGFSQTIPLLMESIAKIIGVSSNLLTNDLFEVTKTNLLAAYEEHILDKHEGDTLAEDVRLSVLKVVHWMKVDKHTALSALTFPKFQQFIKQFTNHVYVKSLVQGNMTSEETVVNIQKFINISKCGPLLPNTRPELRMNEIPNGVHYCRVDSFVPDSEKVVVKNYYQCAGYSIRAIVMVDLLTSIIEDDVFEDLRLVKGIQNYEYSTSFLWHDQGVVGYTIEMSEDYGDEEECYPDDMDSEIEDLRSSLYTLFSEMTDDEWIGVMDVFMDQKKLPTTSKKFKSTVSRNWNAITCGTYVMNETEQELIALKKLKVEDVRKWMAYLTTSGNNIKKLCVQVTGGGSTVTASSDRKYRLKYLRAAVSRPMRKRCCNFINNIQTFKSGLKVLPIPKVS